MAPCRASRMPTRTRVHDAVGAENAQAWRGVSEVENVTYRIELFL